MPVGRADAALRAEDQELRAAPSAAAPSPCRRSGSGRRGRRSASRAASRRRTAASRSGRSRASGSHRDPHPGRRPASAGSPRGRRQARARMLRAVAVCATAPRGCRRGGIRGVAICCAGSRFSMRCGRQAALLRPVPKDSPPADAAIVTPQRAYVTRCVGHSVTLFAGSATRRVSHGIASRLMSVELLARVLASRPRFDAGASAS